MTGILKAFALAFVLLLFVLVPGLQAQLTGTFVYTNNNPSGPNSISAFLVGANGALTQVSGSPFPTRGTGSGASLYASNRITATIVGNFLFASNPGSDSISAFSINLTTGALTAVPGSPFVTGSGAADTSGISLAAAPNGQFLFSGNSVDGTISAFSIGPTGALTPVSGSPFSAGGNPDGINVTPNGQFLAVALYSIGSVAMFNIGPNGSLSAVPGSPFSAGSGVTYVDINCGSNLLFASEASDGPTIVTVEAIGTNGALSPISGSPFSFGGTNSNVGVLSPDGKFLYVSNQFSNEDVGTITSLSVAPGGSLTQVSGSPFANTGGDQPSGMATNQAGTLLYVANLNNTVTGFSVAGGLLTPLPGSPFATGVTNGGLEALTVFPPRSCTGTEPVYVSLLSPGQEIEVDGNTGAINVISTPSLSPAPVLRGQAIGPDGKLYIADTLNSRILRMNQDGSQLETIYNLSTTTTGECGASVLCPAQPDGPSFNFSTGDLFFATPGSNKLSSKLPAGLWKIAAVTTIPFGGPFPAPVNLLTSAQVASSGTGGTVLNNSGDLLIDDDLGNRVLISPPPFDSVSTLISGSPLLNPIGIAVNTHNDVLVANSNEANDAPGNIACFSSTGVFQETYADFTPTGDFPVYMGLDSSGNLFVATENVATGAGKLWRVAPAATPACSAPGTLTLVSDIGAAFAHDSVPGLEGSTAVGVALPSLTAPPQPVIAGTPQTFTFPTYNQQIQYPQGAAIPSGIQIFSTIIPIMRNDFFNTRVLGSPFPNAQCITYPKSGSGPQPTDTCIIFRNGCLDANNNPVACPTTAGFNPATGTPHNSQDIIISTEFDDPATPVITPGFLTADDNQNDWVNIFTGFTNEPVLKGGTNGFNSDFVGVDLLNPGVQLVTTLSQFSTDIHGNYVAQLAVTDNGLVGANGVNLTAGSVVVNQGGTKTTPTSTTVPISLGSIASGNSGTATLTFPSSAGMAGSAAVLRISLTYSGGSSSATLRTTLP
jgi:6-phosphogluconolactonase